MTGGLDLRGVQAVLNGWLIDDLRVDRDNGNADDVLGPDLVLRPAAVESVLTCRGALQSLSGFTEQDDPDVVRVVEQTDARYRALVPLSVDLSQVAVDDVLTVVTVRSPSAGPGLQGSSFVVVAVGRPSSFDVVQSVYLREPTPRRATT